jgi:hypothetical protein
VSPHVNFFRWSQLCRLLAGSGLQVERSRPTTFLSGPGLDILLRWFHLVDWNVRVCDHLPYWCSSDWMLVARPAELQKAYQWRRNALARYRRRLSLRRWGIATPSS